MQRNNWLSVHIFYHNNNNPLIVNCLKPLVDSLRAQGLIQSYFFIKYWMEGPHVRLRLLPTTGMSHEALKALIEPPILAYLQSQPSLLHADAKALQPVYKDLFAAEYGTERWEASYGLEGVMPLRPNNSLAYIDYEPEYQRYGGGRGVELAEWHFEHSSDITIKLLRETNVHIRSVMLGLSAQLMLHFCYGLLRDDQKVIRFLDRYIHYWQTTFHNPQETDTAQFEKKPVWMHPDFQRRAAKIRNALLTNTPEQLTAFERIWAAHIQELRQRIILLATEEQLLFGPQSGSEQGFVADPETALTILLQGYTHMANNRLGTAIYQEVYLSYILKRYLETQAFTREVTL